MRLLRGLLFLPVVALASPALVLILLVILLVETPEGPLRSLLAREVSRAGWSTGFRRFMQQVFIHHLQHNIHSFVLGGAGFLVVVVGLRGLGMLPIELVYVALGVEFTLLTTWAVTVFYTPIDDVADVSAVAVAAATPPAPVVQTADQEKLIRAMQEMTAQFTTLAGNDAMVRSMHDLAAQLALLENRLRITESRFEHLAALDSSLQALSTKLNAIVSDQFNLHVRREFEHLLSELNSRAVTGSGAGNAKAA